MKSVFAFVILNLLAVSAFAVTCTSTENSLETTIAVRPNKQNQLEMLVYRTISGHSVQPQVTPIVQLPVSTGAVVAYGTKDQLQTLVMNLHNRTEDNEILGTYHDSVQGQSLAVTCNFN